MITMNKKSKEKIIKNIETILNEEGWIDLVLKDKYKDLTESDVDYVEVKAGLTYEALARGDLEALGYLLNDCKGEIRKELEDELPRDVWGFPDKNYIEEVIATLRFDEENKTLRINFFVKV